ncbi:lysophospholipid acyltransferase family protein [bacterium]|nr:lysophospholipid acyltransferase family protein [bacterium]
MAVKPKTKTRAFRKRMVARAAALGASILPKLPFRLVRGTTQTLGLLAWYLVGERRRRVLKHLEMAFPDVDPEQRRKWARNSFKHAGAILGEFFWIPSLDEKWDAKYWPCEEGMAQFLDVISDRGKRGCLLMTGHHGSWELLLQLAQRQLPGDFLVVARESDQQLISDLMKKWREFHGARIIYRGDAGLSVYRTLRKGGLVAMLVDQNLRGEGAEIDFFGHPAHTLLGPARLVLQSRAITTTIFCTRAEDGTYRVHVDKPLEVPAASKDPDVLTAQAVDLTRKYTARIEAAIRRDPDQWMWMHRRWHKRKKYSIPLEQLPSLPDSSS